MISATKQLKQKSILQVLAFVWIAIGFICPYSLPAAQNTPQDVTVLFFNDLHGYLTPFTVRNESGKVEVGGIARMATRVKEIRTENEKRNARTFLLIAGDILQGTPMSTIFKGQPDIECFNEMGVDAMTVGNHEFDFGMDNFLKLRQMADFPMISSNIVFKNSGKPLCDGSVSFKLSQSVSLTVIGATTRLLLFTTKPQHVSVLDIRDPVKTVKEVFETSTPAGPVILLSHSSHKTDRAIADAVPQLAAIIAGHDQILMSPYRKVGDVPVFQAFEKGKYLGRIDFTVDPETGKAELVSNTYIPITSRTSEDPVTAGIVQRYQSRMDKKFKEVIGRSESFLDGERERIRYEETALGNFITDIMRHYTGAQLALLNAGALRASIDRGPVTREDIFRAIPYSNELIRVKLTGREIIQTLNRSVMGRREDEDGGFLHVSGIQFTINGRRVENISVGKKREPIKAKKTYSVVINDFMASGGDGYTLFKAKSKIYTGLPLRELVVDTIRTEKIITAKVEDRIVRIGR